MVCPGVRINTSLPSHELGILMGQCSVCTNLKKPEGYDKIRQAVERLLDDYVASHRRLGTVLSSYNRDELLLKLELIQETLVIWSLPGVTDETS